MDKRPANSSDGNFRTLTVCLPSDLSQASLKRSLTSEPVCYSRERVIQPRRLTSFQPVKQAMSNNCASIAHRAANDDCPTQLNQAARITWAGENHQKSDCHTSREVLTPPTLRETTGYWLKLGLLSLGGAAGKVAMMHHGYRVLKNKLLRCIALLVFVTIAFVHLPFLL